MATRLRNFKIDRVSLVDFGGGIDKRGTGEGPRILLAKRTTPSAALVPLLARIAKDYGPISFDEAVMARSIDEITDECGTYLWALRDSLTSILQSDTADKAAQMRASLAQFTTALDAVVGDWFDTEVPDDMVTKRGKTLTAEQRAVLASFRHTLAALVPPAAQPIKENEMAKADLTKLSKSAQDVLAAAGVTELTEEQAVKFTAALPKTPEPEPKPEDVFKGLDPVTKAFVEKAQADATAAKAEAAEAQKIAKAERDQRVTREFIAKAQTLDALPGMNADDFGVVLKGIAEKAPDDWAKLEPLLKSAHAAIKTGALYVEKGRGGEGGGSAEAAVNAKAAELVAKSATKLSLDEAKVQFLETPEGKQLYQRYLDDNPAQTGRR